MGLRIYNLKFFIFSLAFRSWWLTFKSFISPKKIKIGKGTFIHRQAKIKARTIIGQHTCIGRALSIKGHGTVTIGNFCAFGEEIRIITTNHRTNRANLQYHIGNLCGFNSLIDDRGTIEIGNNVWIGDRATIMAGVTVGDGAVIGTGSIVTKNVRSFAIVTGAPAQEYRKRFSEEVIKALSEIKWWNWPIDRIKKNAAFFNKDLCGATRKDIVKTITDNNPP